MHKAFKRYRVLAIFAISALALLFVFNITEIDHQITAVYFNAELGVFPLRNAEFYELWINADTLPKRNKFTDLMVESGYTRNGKKAVIDTIAFAKNICATPSDPNILMDALFANLVSTDVSATLKANLKKQILLSGQTADYYWTEAWNSYQTNPSTINFNLVNTRLKALVKFIMNLPDYQLS